MEMPKQTLFLDDDAGPEGDSQLEPLCWKWGNLGGRAEDTRGALTQLEPRDKNSSGAQGSTLGSNCFRAKKRLGN